MALPTPPRSVRSTDVKAAPPTSSASPPSGSPPSASSPVDRFVPSAALGSRPTTPTSPVPPADPALQGQLAAELTRARLGGVSGTRAGGASPGAVPSGSAAAAEKAGAAVYAKGGDTAYDLGSLEARRQLIANSPQLDNTAGGFDGTRCGAAAITNALIADGSYEKNAVALRKTADQLGLDTSSGAFADALDSMEQGKLTPNQAAEIQERVYEMGYSTQHGVTANGMTTGSMAELSGRLAQNGAFGNSCEVTFHLDQSGPSSNHYTMSVLDHDGNRTYANSWPDTKNGGRATVSDQDPMKRGVCEAGGVGEISLEMQANGQLGLQLLDRTGSTVQSVTAPLVDGSSASPLTGRIIWPSVCVP